VCAGQRADLRSTCAYLTVGDHTAPARAKVADALQSCERKAERTPLRVPEAGGSTAPSGHAVQRVTLCSVCNGEAGSER